MKKMNKVLIGEVTEFLSKCKIELDSWFEIDLPMPELIVLHSAQDVAEIWDMKLGDDLPIAWADTGRQKLYMLQWDEAEKLRQKMPYDFWTILKHEYVHFYWHAIVGTTMPIWMNEGLACYLAGQTFVLKDKNMIFNIRDYFDDNTFNAYAVGYVGVNYLIEKFGKETLLEFLKQLSDIVVSTTKKIPVEAFEGLFKQQFGFGLTKGELKRLVEKLR